MLKTSNYSNANESISMNIYDLKKWIKIHLYDSRGRFKSACCSYSWYSNRNIIIYYNQIKRYTHFLPNDAIMSERVYCIFKNIKVRPKCDCGSEIKYLDMTVGYREYCSSDCSNNSDKKKRKIKNILLSRYGVENASQIGLTPIQLSKMNNSNWLKHQNHVLNLTIDEIANKLGVNAPNLGTKFKKFNIVLKRHSRSSYEREIALWFDSLKINYVQNTRSIIKPLELDFYIPLHNLAVEFNGDYWHQFKSEGYHENKTKLCNNLNICLIHIWENEWLKNKDKIKYNIMKQFVL